MPLPFEGDPALLGQLLVGVSEVDQERRRRQDRKQERSLLVAVPAVFGTLQRIGTRICAATAPPRAELDFAPTAREQDRPRSTTAKNVIAEIGSLLEPLWKLEARISPWIRRICAAQAPIRNVATPPSRR